LPSDFALLRANYLRRYHPLVTQDLSFYEITRPNVNPFCATCPLRALVKINAIVHRVTRLSAVVHYPASRSVKRLGARHPFVRAAIPSPSKAKEFVVDASSNLRGPIFRRRFGIARTRPSHPVGSPKGRVLVGVQVGIRVQRVPILMDQLGSGLMGWDRGTGISATWSRTFAPKEYHSACGGHPTSRNSETRS
jgi:hypothetical protein